MADVQLPAADLVFELPNLAEETSDLKEMVAGSTCLTVRARYRARDSD